MSDAVRYEWVRLRTLRSTWWLSAAAIVLSVGITVALAFGLRSGVRRSFDANQLAVVWTAAAAVSPVPFAAVFGAIVGIFVFGHEYRHGIIRATLTALPRRWLVIAAKLIVPAVWSIVLGLVVLVLDWVVLRLVWGSLTTSHGLFPGPVRHCLLGFVVLTLVWTLIGVGLGALTRSLPASFVIVFVTPLVLEPVLIAVFTLVHALSHLAHWTHYLPFTAGQAMLGVNLGDSSTGQLSPLRGGLVFAAWTLVLLAFGSWRVARRDA